MYRIIKFGSKYKIQKRILWYFWMDEIDINDKRLIFDDQYEVLKSFKDLCQIEKDRKNPVVLKECNDSL